MSLPCGKLPSRSGLWKGKTLAKTTAAAQVGCRFLVRLEREQQVARLVGHERIGIRLEQLELREVQVQPERPNEDRVDVVDGLDRALLRVPWAVADELVVADDADVELLAGIE